MQRKVVREVGGEESGQREKQRRKVLLSGGRERRATEDAAVMENGQSHLPNHSQSRGAQLLPYGAEPGALSLGGPAQPPDSRPPMTTGLIRSEALGSRVCHRFLFLLVVILLSFLLLLLAFISTLCGACRK